MFMNTSHFRIQLSDGTYTTLDKYPWYKKDRFGWPIETIKDQPFKSFIRLVCKNIRKVYHI